MAKIKFPKDKLSWIFLILAFVFFLTLFYLLVVVFDNDSSEKPVEKIKTENMDITGANIVRDISSKNIINLDIVGSNIKLTIKDNTKLNRVYINGSSITIDAKGASEIESLEINGSNIIINLPDGTNPKIEQNGSNILIN